MHPIVSLILAIAAFSILGYSIYRDIKKRKDRKAQEKQEGQKTV